MQNADASTQNDAATQNDATTQNYAATTDANSSSPPVDAGQGGFPMGAYDNCAYATFLDTPGGGGVDGPGGSIVVRQTGSTIDLTYGGDAGALAASLAFTATSGTSATLVAGQELDGIQVVCAPLESAPAATQLAFGSLTYNAGTLFLSVAGTVDPLGDDAGSDNGCTNPGGPAAFFVTCSEPTAAGASDAGSTPTADGSGFVGVYQCSSATQQFGGNVISITGGDGTLTVTQTGPVLTAAYADSNVVGSLGFVAVTDGAAVPSTTNETMQIQCDSVNPAFPGSGPPLTSAATSVPVTSSTLALDGDHVVLGFAGSGCAGESFSVSVLCTAGDGGVWGGAWGHASADDGGASDGAVPTPDSGTVVADGGL